MNDRISYYHLLVQPEQKQTIEVKILNNSAEKQSYKVEVIRAATNKNGLITYDEREKPADESMRIPITDVAKPKSKEVTVDKFSEGKAEIDLHLPSESFSGILLGGIRISLKSDKDEKADQGMSVKNTYGYAIGLLLIENESTPVYGETELTLKSVKPEIDYGSKILEAAIQNSHPEAMKDLTIEGKILPKGKKQAVAEKKMEKVKIAPNSTLPFQIDWGMQEVSAGEYTFKGKVKAESGKEWHFEKNFTITRAVAKKMNKETAFQVMVPDWWVHAFWSVSIVTGGCLLWLSLRLIRRTKKGRKSDET